MSEFSELKAKYIALAGKNPPPMSADALRAKVQELEAATATAVVHAPVLDAPAADAQAAEAPAVDEPAADEHAADEPAIDEPATDDVAVDAPAADAPAAEAPAIGEQSVEDACTELGLSIEKDGHCSVEMVDGVSGAINLSRGDPHRFEAAEAVRAVRAGIAKPRG